MLRVLFAVLLLANAGLFAWQQGHLDKLIPSGREPARMSNQLNADKIKVVPGAAPQQEAPVAAVPTPAPTPAAAPKTEEKPVAPAPVAPASRKPDVAPTPQAAAPAPQAGLLACIEIGDFSGDEARRFGAQLAALNLGNRVARKPLLEASSYIVHIPPQPDKEAVERKAAELRAIGIEDFFIILDNSPLRWGISLGVFRQESAAKVHLAALTERGVRSARIAPRMSPSGLVAFQLRGLAPQEKEALDRVTAGFGQQRERECQG